jgi:glycerol-3-phosphate dehydrogenase (NAD(P)+)
MAVFTVLGAGMMGSAFTVPLADRGHEVRLVGTPLEAALVERLLRGEPHPGLGVPLSAGVVVEEVGRLDDAVAAADVVVFGVSSAGLDWAIGRLAPHAERPLMMITKGLLWDGQELRALPDVVAAALPDRAIHPVAVAGPCIAGELARRAPSSVMLACRDKALAQAMADLVRAEYYHPFVSDDVVGACACAALKNGYAMAYGFAAGLHEKIGGSPGSVAMHNLESAIFAQAALEMQRVVVALGGRAETAVGLAGIGDLDVTNNGNRTGRFGHLLGLGLSLDEAVERMEGATLECIEIVRVMREASTALRARGELGPLPLLDHMAAVVIDGATVAPPLGRFFV